MRRHHNNEGIRQIRRGKTRDQVENIARRFFALKAKILSVQRGEDGRIVATNQARPEGATNARTASDQTSTMEVPIG